jgi:hypothetical protein
MEKIVGGGVNEAGIDTVQKGLDKTYDESPKGQPFEPGERYLKELGHAKPCRDLSELDGWWAINGPLSYSTTPILSPWGLPADSSG